MIGVRDFRMGEEICACIQLVDGEECTAEEIKAFCKDKVSCVSYVSCWHPFRHVFNVFLCHLFTD